MRLAIMLASGPENGDAHTARNLASAAIRLGHEAFVFFDADGVLCAGAFAAQGSEGVSLAGCTHSARQRGVELCNGVDWGSQLDWAQAAQESDRVIVLG